MNDLLVEGRLLEERSLVEAAKAGDVDAYGQLVRVHQSMALRVAHIVCGDADEAHDVAQEAFVKAFHALDRFDTDRPFKPWILTIVRNVARNKRRSAGRRAHLQTRLARLELRDQSELSPEAQLIAATEHRAVLKSVDRLPERQRSVISMRYLAGLSEQETAETLGIPIGTVKSRTARALTALASDLGTSLAEETQ